MKKVLLIADGKVEEEINVFTVDVNLQHLSATIINLLEFDEKKVVLEFKDGDKTVKSFDHVKDWEPFWAPEGAALVYSALTDQINSQIEKGLKALFPEAKPFVYPDL